MKKFVVLIILSIWLGGFFFFAHKINHLTTDNSKKTDAIIVLTGGRNRIVEASKLFNEQKAKHLFISGVAKDISLENIQTAQDIKIDNSKNVEIGNKAENTVENAKETKDWIEKNNIKSIRLVTSNYHIYRSMVEFENILNNVEILPHPVYSQYIEKKWWTSWQTFSLIFKEYNKFICAYMLNTLNIK